MIKKIGANNSKQVVGEIRESQVITTYGIGSIVEFVDESVMICGIDKWDWAKETNYQIHNMSLQKLLDVKYFVKPKTTTNSLDKKVFSLPSVIFPEYMHCNKCQMLSKPNIKSFIRSHGECQNCATTGNKTRLQPSSFVLVCPRGHIEDFPYSWWVHHGEQCPKGEHHKLKMYFVDNKDDLEHLVIECVDCGARRTMKGAASNVAFAKYKCHGNRPWIGDTEECSASEEGEFMQLRIRNESSVYFPCVVSALSIPPWSKKIASELLKYVEGEDDISDETRKYIINRVSLQYKKLGYKYVEDIFDKLINKSKIINTYEDILNDEYQALLCKTTYDPNDSFIVHNEKVPVKYQHLIDEVVSVDRLTVVTALTGFTRLTAPNSIKDPRLSPLSKEPLGWLPATEQKGEGIFIKFNEDKIQEWVANNKARYGKMRKNFEESFFSNNKFSEKYVLLHTFAHLIIRELSNTCGYSASSLKERIYCNDGINPMAGVLIYTSSNDSDGSLGGLIEQAKCNNLETLIDSLLNRGKWCSSDPVCYTAESQGFLNLNYAACFSCTLLPETSCEFHNVLLDRCAVCGMPGNYEMGFLNM